MSKFLGLVFQADGVNPHDHVWVWEYEQSLKVCQTIEAYDYRSGRNYPHIKSEYWLSFKTPGKVRALEVHKSPKMVMGITLKQFKEAVFPLYDYETITRQYVVSAIKWVAENKFGGPIDWDRDLVHGKKILCYMCGAVMGKTRDRLKLSGCCDACNEKISKSYDLDVPDEFDAWLKGA